MQKKIFLVSNGVSGARPKRNVAPKNYANWNGGSATIVSPVEENNGDQILAELQCVPSVVSNGVMDINSVKIVKNNKRKADEDLLDPEEEEKRRMRRDRNRMAAAKCRKKRLDQIESLQVEVENWERKNKKLEQELAMLRHEKDELAFVLQAHKTSCKFQNNFANVKVEPINMMDEENNPVFVTIDQTPITSSTPVIVTSSAPVKPQRPASLSLAPITKNIEGVTIETPSNAILSFDSLMLDGRTGLTPTTVLTPLKSSSNLNTPTCGSQQRNILITPLFSPSTEAALLTSL